MSSTMVTTTPQPRINLEFLFDSNGNNNHGFRFMVDDNNNYYLQRAPTMRVGWKCSIHCKAGASRKRGSFGEGRLATLI
ncbi:hypothetical protein GmHk_14G042040 [Glycine max]|nr:hypothetical protein GmHk_14G042040 [Glycine max]